MSKLGFIGKLLDGVEVQWRALGEVAEIYGGLSGKSKSDFEDGNARYVPYKNIFANAAVDLTDLGFVKVSAHENQHEVRFGDVLFTGSSEIADEAGMSSALTAQFEGPVYLNSFCFGVRFDEKIRLHPGFLKHLFRSHHMRSEIASTASGVTRFNISKATFKKIRIPIPQPGSPEQSFAIQAAIASILDSFAALLETLTAELTTRKKQNEYYRDQLLRHETGAMGWKLLGEIGEVRMCKRIFKHETSDSGNIPFYKIGTFGKEPNAYISRELFDKYRRNYSYPQKGEILISASGTIGRAVIFDGQEAYFQDSNIVWIANDESVVLNKYLFYFYHVADWNPSDGGVIQRLYNDNLRKLKIRVPYPDDTAASLAEQARIVTILDKFDTLTNSISEGLPREIELRQKQYEYYRELLLKFPKPGVAA